MFVAVAALASCSSEDFPLTQSDEATFITFGATKGTVLTRAEDSHEHREWDDEKDPTTMTVCGYADDVAIFSAPQEVTYADFKWSYEPKKYWATYLEYSSRKFVACMPHSDKTSISREGEVVTVTMPEIDLTDPIQLDEDSKVAPLVCHDLVSANMEEVQFQMDRTLAGYNFQFQMGSDMGQLRLFRIKSVKVCSSVDGSGNLVPLATGGTMTCTYNADGKNVVWSNLKTTTINETNAVAIGENVIVEGVETPQTIDVKSAEFVPWVGNFFAIPTAAFNPRIIVTYDDIVVDEKGNIVKDANGEAVVTRKGVKSDIVFNSTNFPGYIAAVSVGKLHPIKIKIVPSYLYVLADVDQTYGYLVIN